ncbi:zinc transporter ZIP4-like isoform X2 [Oncorhynchus tshawytscha]|uniref:zinc transporter ZIP4-like isoform X2 n=1 Tax=Oncorhynchus tshawytscha TaxID=74940 RepID=UPI001C3D2F3A|nr:zinc transporter ZIP4-like isoform X2 [Oncorhynchus tshawytscha]
METIYRYFPVILLCLSLNLFSYAWGSPVDVYGKVVELVSPGEEYLDEMSVRSFFKLLEKRVQCPGVSCEKCLSVQSVDQLVGNFTSTGGLLHQEGFFRVAAGCCLYLSSPSEACSAVRAGRWGDETDNFIHEITGYDHGDGHGDMESSGIETLLHNLKKHYKPDQQYDQCLTGQDIMEEMNEGVPHNMDVMFGYIVYHALQGDCMTARALPEEDYFLDFIFNSFGSDNITIHELEGLMKSLQLGGIHEEDHDHRDQEGHNDDHGHDDHVDHDHSDHSTVSRGRGGRSGGDAFRTSHEEGYHQRNISSWELTCFSPEELIKIHGLNGSSLSRSDVARLSPALVQQLLSGACNSISPPTGPLDQLSTTEKFVYASIANLLICLAALVGVMVLLCTSCSSVFQLVIQFCVSLAVGSLTGDALLHLLPMFLGLHVHSEGTDHSHSEEVPDYICKILVMMAGIYCFYLMETIFSIITTHKDSHHHSLHHHGEESEPHHCDHGKVLEMYLQEKNNKQSISQTDLVESEHSEDTEKAFPEQNQLSREQRLLPYMVTIGDGIHNFADGLAIGAAFSVSWNSGLATSLAVFCHELPHELGDFAILLHSGLSVKKALMLNVGSALTSFIGLYIALTVSTDLATKQWIAAITSGLFLYVGLADMLPTMIHADNRRPWLMFLLQNLGLLSGWGILLLLSLYEEKIGF